VSIYPSTIPSTTDYPDRQDDIDWVTAERYNELKNEILAICKELGVLPKGSYSDVRARLDSLESGLGKAFEKVAEVEVSSDCDYVDFTGLDGNSAWFYVLFATIKNPTASGSAYHLYVNGDTTDTNYYCQYITGNGTNVTPARVNEPIIGYVPAGNRVYDIVNISKDPDGYFRYYVNTNRYSSSSIQVQIQAGVKTATIDNITSLRVQANVSNAIGAGSKFILFKARRG